jgi:hypothetical protein
MQVPCHPPGIDCCPCIEEDDIAAGPTVPRQDFTDNPGILPGIPATEIGKAGRRDPECCRAQGILTYLTLVQFTDPGLSSSVISSKPLPWTTMARERPSIRRTSAIGCISPG